jgi:glycosyltransferase involved in cell wall biosynthesis
MMGSTDPDTAEAGTVGSNTVDPEMAEADTTGSNTVDPGTAGVRPEGPLGTRWRAAREAAQEQAMPSGQTVVSSPAPFGAGGLGRHLQEIADALDRRGGPPAICMCGVAHQGQRPSPTTSSRHHELHVSGLATSLRPLTRFSPAWSNLRQSVAFDGYAARRLPGAGEHLIAFNGQALKQFDAAKRANYDSISLLSANSHLRRVVRQHARAHRQYPLEGSWATRLLGRNLEEYERADRIYVASRYTWESFVEEGCREEVLSLFPFTPDPRYAPEVASAPAPDAAAPQVSNAVASPASDAAAPPACASDTFDVVFIGRLCVAKGVPLLVDALTRLPHRDLRLVLVGGWSSRGMRRFLQEACARDPRIEIGPGDPLPHLRGARLCAHPTYEDGFAYAPAEALACGVPVLVTEDTGMKDLLDPGVNGLILPTGDLPSLTEAIDAAYRGEAFSG